MKQSRKQVEEINNLYAAKKDTVLKYTKCNNQIKWYTMEQYGAAMEHLEQLWSSWSSMEQLWSTMEQYGALGAVWSTYGALEQLGAAMEHLDFASNSHCRTAVDVMLLLL
jgi:uncharacterized membrane protein